MTERLRADVAIVGGGIAGCAAAAALRQAGLTVVLLEKGLCGAGASGVNFGGVRQQGRHLAELPLARRARPLWDRMRETVGEDVEFEATGHIKLARSEADMAELERYARDAAEYGLRPAAPRRERGPGRAALARRDGGRSLALSRGRAGEPAPRRAGLRAARATARCRRARARGGDRRRADGRRFRDRAPKISS